MRSDTVNARESVSFGRILALAWPVAIASASAPLLGLVDAWAIGRSDTPLAVGAVALGGVIFATLYWAFGFLRMSAAGGVAQAVGRGDEEGARVVLAHGVAIGLVVGTGLALLQAPIGAAAFFALASGAATSDATFEAARSYYAIRIWAAPAALGAFAILGWLSGRGLTGAVMAVSVGMNVLNVILDYWFVLGLGMGAAGVALGTAIAEVFGLVLSAGFALWALRKSGGVKAAWSRARLFDKAALKSAFVLNRDIFIRTLILVTIFSWFTKHSAAYGDVVLSANQILLQLVLMTGLALDGVAIAAEALVGRAIGDKSYPAYRDTVRKSAVLAAAAAALFSLAYLVFGGPIAGMMTTSEAVRAAVEAHFLWAALSPVALAACFFLDGVFIGAMRGRELRNAMLQSGALYVATWFVLAPSFGNHGHWAAFGLFFLFRAFTLWAVLPRIGAAIKAP
ncbi:MAG: MATE family efflux transporter [Pseudomonadota bacterium]